MRQIVWFIALILILISLFAQSKELLWGDTHLHTSYSFDAFLNGNMSADPEVAYRYAKGMPVIHPYNRTRVRINTPLDFLVVTDHAEFYGGVRDIYYHGIQDPDPGPLERLIYWYNEYTLRKDIDSGGGTAFFNQQLPRAEDPYMAAQAWTSATAARILPGADISAKNAWSRLLKIAETHNEPGKFTAMIGWEWSTVPGGANLHRIVMTDASAETAAKFMPFSSTTSPFPEDLWQWLDATSKETGANFLAIPHNSNISKGVMFSDKSLRGEPIDAAYARTRMKWEPVVEITQIKGDSETHPALSPGDPFANFETYPYYLQQDRTQKYIPTKADYIRSALGEGLRLEGQLGNNPFQFGVIGSTDSHTGLSSAEEPNFWGKMAHDSIPENKQDAVIAIGPSGWSMQAAGLAAVWAEDNTREAILAAFKRREVYATTGPRIRLKFSASTPDAEPVPMGSNLPGNLIASPGFSVTAQKDPQSANLDRLQIVKGWLDEDGNPQERVFNVAWSGQRVLDSAGELAAVGDTVNRSIGTWTDDIGAPELNTNWVDADFDPRQAAFYYVRVLQIPTPRHSLLDAIALGMSAPTEGPSVIQERAYSSPIWFSPEK